MDEGTKKSVGLAVGSAVGIGTSVGFLWGIDPEIVKSFLSETAQSQIAQAGFFFTVAAWLHSGRVKKEIAKNFASLTAAINNVALTLRQDLDKQKEILENHGTRIDTLERTKTKI